MSDENLYWKDKGGYFRTYIPNSFYIENSFKDIQPESEELPRFEEIRHLLPDPVWEDHEDAVRCYWRCWEIGFGNLKKPVSGSGFITNYIDPAFNGNAFMWDSVFMLMFGLYGTKAFNFQKTLDNFYAKQHRDGFICREINEITGSEQFHRYDPSSTGPNLLAWSEWSYYSLFKDEERLSRVFPVLAGYHRWMRNFRTWQDGTYFSSGWGCGMDNQPRIREDYPFEFFHGFMSWIDTTLQQLLSARLLVTIAQVLGRSADATEFSEEAEKLYRIVNEKLWDNEKAFYFDKYADESLSDVMSIGSYWALLAEAVPGERKNPFVRHLSDENTFNRPHRVPTLAANHPLYKKTGGYWCGGVWAPTNYMVLKGLEKAGEYVLAAEIARNHHDQLIRVFKETGTVYENYAPEAASKGDTAAHEFVGWTGVSAINVLFEFVMGIKPNLPEDVIVWDVRLLEGHGINRYPLPGNHFIDLYCKPRSGVTEEPEVLVKGTRPVRLKVLWEGREKIVTG